MSLLPAPAPVSAPTNAGPASVSAAAASSSSSHSSSTTTSARPLELGDYAESAADRTNGIFNPRRMDAHLEYYLTMLTNQVKWRYPEDRHYEERPPLEELQRDVMFRILEDNGWYMK